MLGADGYAEMLRHTTQLNRVGVALAQIDGVHAMTGVTGFGLAGHLLEICRVRSCLLTSIWRTCRTLPVLWLWAKRVATGASGRNWAAYGAEVHWPETAPEWQRTLLTDPQTSGGLLVSCAPGAVDAVLRAFFMAMVSCKRPSWGRMQACTAGRFPQLHCS